MKRLAPGSAAVSVGTAVVGLALLSSSVAAAGVGGATWTPSASTTSAEASRFLVEGDAILYRTVETWDRTQAQGLDRYQGIGLRYTLEVNDRSGRLSATGYWATNHPDPAYDRDDDDGDGRWEEAEIIAGRGGPEPGRAYTSMVQFSRWHPKRVQGSCTWAWDRRSGRSEVLSQLSRELLGEWQAERYTYSYEALSFPRVGPRPELGTESVRPRCRDQRPGVDQRGYVVTFSRPLRWTEFRDLVSVGSGKWTAFEAIGSHRREAGTWTCGGPVEAARFRPCREMGMSVSGITAAAGYFDTLAADQLRDASAVAAVDDLQDALTDLLAGIGGLDIQPPGLTINDRYWELVLGR